MRFLLEDLAEHCLDGGVELLLRHSEMRQVGALEADPEVRRVFADISVAHHISKCTYGMVVGVVIGSPGVFGQIEPRPRHATANRVGVANEEHAANVEHDGVDFTPPDRDKRTELRRHPTILRCQLARRSRPTRPAIATNSPKSCVRFA